MSSEFRNKKAWTKLLPKWNVYVWYSVIFVFVSLSIFLQFIIYGKTLLWRTDGFFQWYSILSKLKNIVGEFFQGNGFAFWSWDTGIGADVFANYALVLCDPFCYLAVLFPYDKLDVAYTFILITKLYTAGLIMLVFLKYKKKEPITTVLLSISYVFSAWTFSAIRHVFFLTPLILFPLIILGIDFVADKKSPLLLIVGIMLSIANSLYFSYMIAILAVFYIIIRFFVQEEDKRLSSFAKYILKYALYALIGGVILPAPILFPSLYGLLNASTGSGIDINIFPTLKHLLRFIPSFVSMYETNGNYSILGMNIVMVAMIPAIILLIKKRITSIYMFIICLLIAIMPIFQSAMNGFSYSAGRWCFAFCFFFVYAAADVLEDGILESNLYVKYVIRWFCLIGICSLAGNLLWKAITLSELFIIILNLCFAGIYLYVKCMKDEGIERKEQKIRLAVIGILNIIIIPLCYFNPNLGNNMETFMSQGQVHKIYDASAMKSAGEIEDTDFYRLDTVDFLNNDGTIKRDAHTPANFNIYYQAHSLAEYLSTIDENWLAYNQMLDNSAGNFRRTCMYSNDNRSRMDFLLGVRYFLYTNADQKDYAGYKFTKKGKSDDVTILKSPYKASLGYVYNKKLSESEFMKYSAVEREQLLMQSIVLEDSVYSDIDMAEEKEYQLDVQKSDAVLYDENEEIIENNRFTITKENTKYKIKLQQTIQQSEVYVVFHKLSKKPVMPDQMRKWKNDKLTGLVGELAENKYDEKIFLSNYLSYIPYENFSIILYADGRSNVRKRLINAAGEPQGIRGTEDYMLNLGYYDVFEDTITCEFGNVGEYSYDSIEVVSMPVQGYEYAAEELTKNRLKITKNYGDYLKGTIKSETGGMLYLSILYNEGWKIYIDGEKADHVYRVDKAFTGVEISPGRHKIELRYRPLGYPYTLLSSAAGILMTAALGIVYRKKGRKQKLK